MIRSHRFSSSLIIPTLLALTGSTSLADTSTSSWKRPAHSCATHQFTPAVMPQPQAKRGEGPVFAPGPQRVIHLNRFGGTYTAAQFTNSGTSTTQLLDGGVATIRPAVVAGDFDWPLISACVRDHFKKWDIRFVETKPPADFPSYIEAVVGGDGSELGFGAGSGILGIASADNFCGVTEKGIAFSFSENHSDIPMKNLELCATIAHEIGHITALEHETLPADVMSYVPVFQSGPKSFATAASACGTEPGQEQGCSCGGSSTNSGARLGTFIGLRPVESTPPTLTVTAPGTTAAPSFEVTVTAKDDMEMADVVVWVDGVEVGFDAIADADVYKIKVTNVREGDRMVKIMARDRAGNETSKDLTVKVAKAAIGETCLGNDSCTDSLCIDVGDGNGNFCSKSCVVADDTCPNGFDCVDAGGQAVCIINAEEAEGGCCQSSSGSNTTALLGLLGVGLVLSRRRRRR